MDIDTTLECRGAGAPYIPPDIVNHIVSHVGEDRATLLSCSLVCRSWSFETSPFIFERLHIYSDKRTVYEIFYNAVLGCVNSRDSTLLARWSMTLLHRSSNSCQAWSI